MLAPKTWTVAQQMPKQGEVLLWLRTIERREGSERLKYCLSSDELTYLERIRSPVRRLEFLNGRALLRHAVATTVGLKPEELPLTVNAYGKPLLDADVLRGESSSSLPHFSLSHSGDWLGLALAMDMPVGLDLEGIDSQRDCAGLALRFYAQAEREALVGKACLLLESFHCVWVRKESYVKGLGEGLRSGFGNFTVSVDPEENPARINHPENTGEWFNHTVPAPQGYAAALATPCASVSLRLM
ncbi:MAG: 4'-phosphopantetheinyl transferase family protein [Candidatus Eutrophobiaceae bacterium]